jgi:hypothetical protein
LRALALLACVWLVLPAAGCDRAVATAGRRAVAQHAQLSTRKNA